VAYNDPGTPSYSPPPLDPRASEGRTDNYGWQGQAPNSPQQPYQQPNQQTYQSYGQPAPGGYYAGPMAPATSGYAIASLVCSLLGYIGVFGIGPLLGIIFGHMAIREIDRSNGLLQGRGLAQAGLILGYIALGLILLAVVFFTIILIVGAGSAAFPNN
jgi:uncharacterized protein DUF4190